MRVAYADPPYVGCADLYPEKQEVDHRALIDRLVAEFPDGWALSLHTPSLRELLPMCPDDVRVMAWVKPFCAFKANVNPAYAWEPVIVRGGRRRTREQDTVRDWIAESITLRRGMVGAKPLRFCRWLFEVMNLQPGDEFVDLFPGSGAVTQAWAEWIGSPLPTQIELGRAEPGLGATTTCLRCGEPIRSLAAFGYVHARTGFYSHLAQPRPVDLGPAPHPQPRGDHHE